MAERNGKQATLAINKLLDVEEHVWSPMYGLKGNIDATIQTVVEGDEEENGEATTAHARPRRKTLLVPLELKTGRNTSDVAHRAQTSLYTLLLSDRYGWSFFSEAGRIFADHRMCRCRRGLWTTILHGNIHHDSHSIHAQ